MNILIIENINLKKYKYSLLEKTLLTSFSILPTLYPRRLAAITPKEHNVYVFNDRYEELKINEKYDLVNIHFNTTSTKKAYEIADKFREKKVKIVLSGLHASALPDEAIQHADSILFGRGELNWLTLLNDFKDNKLKKIYPPADYNKSKITLENLKKTEKDKEILLPIGGSTFLNATLKNSSNVLFDIGAGVIAEKKTEEAIIKINRK